MHKTLGVSLSFATAWGYENFYFPFNHVGPGNLPEQVLYALKDVIEAAPRIVFHNAKFDLVALSNLGIYYFGKEWYCTMVLAHLVNENWPRSKSLEACAAHYLGPDWGKEKSEVFDDFVKTFGWAYLPVVLTEEYAKKDAELAIRLMGALIPYLQEENLFEYWPHKRDLIETVIVMERRGTLVNQDLCRENIAIAEEEMAKAQAALGGLNPRSPIDMKELFIDRLGLEPIYSPKTGNLTFDKAAIAVYEEALEHLGGEEAEHVKVYRGWGHAKSNFYQAYLDHVGPDGALRPNYLHHKDEDEGGTVTGRLSCKNPNLQQIPRSSQKSWNGSIKKLFVPRPGYTLWEWDFAQLELRLAAAYVKEPTLLPIFREGRDVFTEMAQALGMTRFDTKTLTYSMQYGAGVKRIMTAFKVSEAKARQIRDNYFDTFPRFQYLSDISQAKVKSVGKLQLWSGRFRHFNSRKEEAHKALNSVIQGGAADIVERRMVAIMKELDDSDSLRMLLQVHDSVVGEVKIGREQEVTAAVQHMMVNVEPDFGVVFAVDAHRFGE